MRPRPLKQAYMRYAGSFPKRMMSFDCDSALESRALSNQTLNRCGGIEQNFQNVVTIGESTGVMKMIKMPTIMPMIASPVRG
jgi:hypothetical protein